MAWNIPEEYTHTCHTCMGIEPWSEYDKLGLDRDSLDRAIAAYKKSKGIPYFQLLTPQQRVEFINSQTRR